jgi:hypothetical protein
MSGYRRDKLSRCQKHHNSTRDEKHHTGTVPAIITCKCGLRFSDHNSLRDHAYFCYTVQDAHSTAEPQQTTPKPKPEPKIKAEPKKKKSSDRFKGVTVITL